MDISRSHIYLNILNTIKDCQYTVCDEATVCRESQLFCSWQKRKARRFATADQNNHADSGNSGWQLNLLKYENLKCEQMHWHHLWTYILNSWSTTGPAGLLPQQKGYSAEGTFFYDRHINRVSNVKQYCQNNSDRSRPRYLHCESYEYYRKLNYS
jgi:hypothetical protein